MRRFLFIVGSILVSGVFLYFALRDIPLAAVQERIQQTQLGWVIAAFGMVLVALWARAVRWRGLLPSHTIAMRDANAIIGITFALNLLPLRAGEVARSLLATRHGVPLLTAATSVIVERLIDTLVVILLLVAALTQTPNIPEQTARVALTFGILAIIGFLVLLFFARYPQVAHGLLAFSERIIPLLKRLPLERLVDNVLAGLEPLTHWRLFAHVILWTAIGWSLSLFPMYFLTLALGITDVPAGVLTVLGIALASFSIAVPLSIGAVGPLQAAIIVAGQMVGLDDVRGLSLGLVFHGVTALAYIAYGLVGFWTLGVSLREVMQAAPPAGSATSAGTSPSH